MPWTTLIFLGLTIASWRFAQTHTDHVARFLGVLSAVACLIVSLAAAPILIKSIILVALLLNPFCPASTRGKNACTQPCMLRKQRQSTP